MKRLSFFALICYLAVFASYLAIETPAFGGNVKFVRRATGNSQFMGTNHYGIVDSTFFWNQLHDGVSESTPAGNPSVVVPLTDVGTDTAVDPTTGGTATATVNGGISGNPDHQAILDHTASVTITSQIDSTMVSGDFCQHSEVIYGDLDVKIDGDGCKWVNVSWDTGWGCGAMGSGGASIGIYDVEITVYRDDGAVVTISGDGRAANYFASAYNPDDGDIIGTADTAGDFQNGTSFIDNKVGFMAYNGERIRYVIRIFYEFDTYGSGVNSGTLFDWRFALEDSGLSN